MPRRSPASFHAQFEGRAVLDGLLDLAGSRFDTEGVLVRFREAVRQGEPRASVIPTLFEGEPRFQAPAVAQKLYENLFGLWQLAGAGGSVPLEAPPKAPRPPKPVPAASPGPFGEAPDPSWVEAAWRYLEDLAPKGIQKLEHAFENRQDALLGALEGAGLSDEAFAQARFLLFELWAMMDIGWPHGLRSVTEQELAAPPSVEVPKALLAYADEALFEAEQDEEAPLSPAESARVRAWVTKALGALWGARKAP